MKNDIVSQMASHHEKVHHEYARKYGENVAVFYQNGKFFEMFSSDDEKRLATHTRISTILNCKLSRRDSNMSGFPLVSVEKNIKRLVQAGYTVVVLEQTKEMVGSVSEKR